MDETSQEFNVMNNKALTQTLNAIDQINITDPNTVMIVGETHPKEFIYCTQMSACLHQYWSEPRELKMWLAWYSYNSILPISPLNIVKKNSLISYKKRGVKCQTKHKILR